jgi:ribonuclease HI
MRYKGKEKQLQGGEKDTTNNRMELKAVIVALEQLTRPVAVRVTTDSKYVKQGITEWIQKWKRNGWRTAAKKPVKNSDLWRELDELVSRHDVVWEWVKGHSGHPDNELADALANRGIDELEQGSEA